VSIHSTVVEAIKRDILSGRLKPGDQIPSLSELRATHHCSYGTIRGAILVLRAEGWIEGFQGRGTFVKGQL